ncbi:DinB family protein [Derxia lacustris]|uniref:DinB family protein n=1 Tax=Derxia lacustris TaxID=764842 RepID=UPI000A16EF22|nr:DinB family protein [Derxia lacustris]
MIPEPYITLARYHAWATRELIERHVAPMPEPQYRAERGLVFGSVHGTLNHLLVAERLWFARFAGAELPVLALDAEVEPDREALARALLTSSAGWSGWLADLDPARLDAVLVYTRVNGEAMRTPFGATLAHVFNHGTHHRGQISAALTGFGRPAPELDLIRMLQAEAAR